MVLHVCFRLYSRNNLIICSTKKNKNVCVLCVNPGIVEFTQYPYLQGPTVNRGTDKEIISVLGDMIE